jgi:transformation/transcription domain-associated protein
MYLWMGGWVGRQLLARALWLLGQEDVAATVVATVEANEEVPLVHWIPFIPQLLASLGRAEARFAQGILMALVRTYPQALYCSLRTALIDIRERIQARQPPPAPAAGAAAAAPPAATQVG